MELGGIPERRLETAGCWAGIGFRGYPDNQMSDARKIARLLVFYCSMRGQEAAAANSLLGLPAPTP